ncbi:choice-of-anchor E domain-containing protein [Aulosira sp. FACHB-615]|uniref:choice-of-anchor E domain-containing protein n=2 Tax=Nostocales TaxID=1161 RepID=UPI001686ED50|nr:PEP-CTERM sorting domain-containing protein [Aulosira sp. FACHB-615]MBD2486239.1 PEP-CTERM sorting domain-containing protein [Aulosira sp. FACHB-615]
MTTKLFQTLAAATTLAGIVATAGAANAASLSYTTQYQYKPTDGTPVSADGFYVTDIEDIISVNKFDSKLGTLKSVTIDFIGDLKGDARFENRSSRAATVLVNLAGELSLELPAGVERLNLTPTQSYAYQVARYDGRTDFSGASGRTVNGLSATLAKTLTVNAGDEFFQYFLGKGTADFTFKAFANSNVTGSGNFDSQINTYAAANLAVTYDYDPKAVPEPSAAIGLGLVAGIGLMSQRRKNWLKASN